MGDAEPAPTTRSVVARIRTAPILLAAVHRQQYLFGLGVDDLRGKHLDSIRFRERSINIMAKSFIRAQDWLLLVNPLKPPPR